MGEFTRETTDSNFENDVLKSSTPVLVDFWAEWCPPCRALAPKLEEIAQELKGKVDVRKVNVDDNPNVASKFGVVSIPTMIIFKDGRQMEKMVGNHPKDNIVTTLNKYI